MSSRPKDRHHIIPKSRCKEFGIDPNFEGNMVKVSTSKHRAYHTLFGNATPEEAMEIIRDEWSLSETGEREFKRITNVRLFRKRKK